MFLKAKIATSGRCELYLKSSHVKRTRYAHKVSLASLHSAQVCLCCRWRVNFRIVGNLGIKTTKGIGTIFVLANCYAVRKPAA